jgi:hypothetical protein
MIQAHFLDIPGETPARETDPMNEGAVRTSDLVADIGESVG